MRMFQTKYVVSKVGRGKKLLKTILASLIAEKCISEDIKPERTKNIKVAEFSATGRTATATTTLGEKVADFRYSLLF